MSGLNHKNALLKTVSVLALTLFGFSAAHAAPINNDPYGYGNVPLPPPQPQYQQMMMPSFQAQQAGYAPLNQYAPQYATQTVSYVGQSTPQVVTTPQYGVVPNYLPATRASSYGSSASLSTPQASSVGYVVTPQNGAVPVAQAMNVPANSGYVQTQSYSYGTQAAPVIGAAQPYTSAQYGAPSVTAQAPSASVNVPVPSYQAPSFQAPSVTAPSITAQAPSVNVGAPSYTAPAGSITAAPTYDTSASYNAGSYQVASNAPAYATPSYTAPSYGYQAPQQQVAVAQDPSQYSNAQQPQVQTYSYGTQQPAYTTQTQTQVYSPSTAFAVQQDSYPQQTAQASTPSSDVSLATEASSPWYLAIRSGLTIPSGTSFNRAAQNWQQDFETGWQLGTAAGYEFKSFNAWLAPRAEIELTYDQALVDSNTVAGTKTSDPNAYGFVRSLDLMANGYLDFRANRYLSPYVGGGIGVGYSDFDRLGNSATGVVMDDNDVGFVWQAMAGLGISLSSNSTVDFGYRYQQNTGLNLKAGDGTVTNTDLSKHVVMIGFRNNL